MALLSWNSSYSVNVGSCDAEHQKLFSLINQLHDAMKVGRGRAVLADIVGELEKYTKTHFQAEEALMERSQYPDINAHRLQHREFVSKVAAFKKQLKEDTGADSVEVLAFLQDWLSRHILETDKKYAPHMNSCGIN